MNTNIPYVLIKFFGVKKFTFCKKNVTKFYFLYFYTDFSMCYNSLMEKVTIKCQTLNDTKNLAEKFAKLVQEKGCFVNTTFFVSFASV